MAEHCVRLELQAPASPWQSRNCQQSTTQSIEHALIEVHVTRGGSADEFLHGKIRQL